MEREDKMVLVIIKHREGEGVFELPDVPAPGESHFCVPDGSLLTIIGGEPWWLQGNFFNVGSVVETHSERGESWTIKLEDIVTE